MTNKTDGMILFKESDREVNEKHPARHMMLKLFMPVIYSQTLKCCNNQPIISIYFWQATC